MGSVDMSAVERPNKLIAASFRWHLRTARQAVYEKASNRSYPWQSLTPVALQAEAENHGREHDVLPLIIDC
jgi:hypothetical protein